ncbi:MAG: hypothetical protein JO257_26305, partial [Deltaproteobacteria bacterium]|nr:hypothetical protein [Deltaproteobacteria bacterium]
MKRSLALLWLSVCVACNGGAKKARREGSAAPVVVVNEPIFADAAVS